MSKMSRQLTGKPSNAALPEHWNLPSEKLPLEFGDTNPPKFNRVIGNKFLSVISPAIFEI